MRRLLVMLCSLLLVLALCVGASATSAKEMNVLTSVSKDGSCQVTMTVNLHIDTQQESLVFPVPREASNITLNGARVGTQQTENARLIDLTPNLGGMTGDFSFSISYSLYNLVSYVDDSLQLSLPMLAGFEYPIEKMEFTVTMPGTLSVRPSFYSGYHQKNIEKDLNFSVFGANITGRTWKELKDHETLRMTLAVTEDMFPQRNIVLPSLEDMGLLVNVFAIAALLYWILFLRNFPARQQSQTVAPEGYSAGQMGSVLTLQEADLSLMVFSWAQLGYLTIYMDRRGHVYLDKRMEMGNERSSFEQRCFQNLFSRRLRVDTSSMNYIYACQDAARMKPHTQGFTKPRSGNIKIFRTLCALCGAFSGVSLAVAFSTNLAYPWLVILPMALLGLLSCLHMLRWMDGVVLNRTGRFWLAVVLAAVWLVIGYLAGELGVSIWLVCIQLIGGMLQFFGGRRTETGKNATAQVLGLRRYLRKLTPEQVQHLCRTNPDFFFDMVPYAMALHVSGVFARRFGKARQPMCPYILTADAGNMTAKQWKQLMHQILGGMTARQRQMPLENMMKTLQSVRASAAPPDRRRKNSRNRASARRR